MSLSVIASVARQIGSKASGSTRLLRHSSPIILHSLPRSSHLRRPEQPQPFGQIRALSNWKNNVAAKPWREHVTPDKATTPTVYTFFHKSTSTWQYVVVDPNTLDALIIDPALDYEPSSGTITTETADGILKFIEENGFKVTRILETHAHADHLTAAQHFKRELGAHVPVCIGSRIKGVQNTFAPIYDLSPDTLGNNFDQLLEDEEEFTLGKLSFHVIHLPGHTPDHVGYVCGKAVFVGDSIFLPDVGSARADFPGGDPKELFISMQRLLSLSDDTRLYVGHDYPDSTREQSCFATVLDERTSNKHGKSGTDVGHFIKWRAERDATLGTPRLLHPALQVNIRAGRLPPADEMGRMLFKIPVKSTVPL